MFPVLRVTAFALLGFALPVAAQQPTIDKIDPPNWFAALPSPMLLIHGTGLANAVFSGAPSTRTVTSPNGHWAMLWLDTHATRASTLHLTAGTAGGTASFDYKLAPRRYRRNVRVLSRRRHDLHYAGPLRRWRPF